MSYLRTFRNLRAFVFLRIYIVNASKPIVTQLLPSYQSPLVSREMFAEMLFGSKEFVGVVVGMVNKGYLPTVSIGKYSFINLAILHKQCLEKEFSL